MTSPAELKSAIIHKTIRGTECLQLMNEEGIDYSVKAKLNEEYWIIQSELEHLWHKWRVAVQEPIRHAQEVAAAKRTKAPLPSRRG